MTLTHREVSTRHTLVRSNPLTCMHNIPGRTSVALSCTTCNGTGYLTGQRSDIPNIPTLGAPYNTLFFVIGEIQMGHGLRGAGGSSSFTDGDVGSEFLGDAVFIFFPLQRDNVTGGYVTPIVGSTPRPDRIVRASDKQIFTVLHDLDESYGTSPLYHSVALGIGTQGSAQENVPE